MTNAAAVSADGWLSNENFGLRQAWHPVARAEDVPGPGQAPHRVELLGEAWVLARIGGELVGLRDECPHRLAPLSAGRLEPDRVRCGYHGWAFDGDGTCVDLPAVGRASALPGRARVDRPAAVAVHLGLVWLAPEPPLTPLPVVPEHDDPTFTRIALDPWDWDASAAQMADNFLDVAHFPFTHRSTFGDPDDREVSPYRVVRDGWCFSVDHDHSTKALADSHRDEATDGQVEPAYEVHPRTNRFVFTAPHHVYLRIHYQAEDVVLVITFFHQPIDATRTRLWCCDYRDDVADGRSTAAATAAFQRAVGEEDRQLLEQLRHKGIPLGPGWEVHTRADRITVELRRVLGDLVRAAGAPREDHPPTTGPWRRAPGGPTPDLDRTSCVGP